VIPYLSMPLDERTRDRVQRSYARLTALRPQIAQESRNSYYVDERLIQEYHAALQPLREIGFDIDEFLVPESDIRHQVSSSNYLTNEKHYTQGRSTVGTLVTAKIDAAITYFEMTLSDVDIGRRGRGV
jgi:hypothetical protein